MSTPLHEQLRSEAEAWREAGLERHLSLAEGVDFSSNDYLGLARDPRVVEAAQEACREWGAGAPAARLLNGNLAVHQQAEAEAAHWMGSEAALLFPSGWQANQALLTTLAERGDVLFCDALNHASLIDAARLSRARVEIFAHNDVTALEAALARHPAARRRVVVVEDVYSMDGDRAPLSSILKACATFDAYLIRDMAHAAGLFEQQGLAQERVLACMFTGGKALGLAGGFVCASRLVIDTLVNHGRSFVFTTAVPPMLAGALRKAMQIVQAEPERARTVFARAELLRTLLRERGFPCPGESPIVPVIVGTADRAMAVAEAVRAAGCDVRAVRPPSVAEGSSRLRIVVHADHTEEQIRVLAEALASAMQEEQRRAVIESPSVPRMPSPLMVCGTDTEVGKTLVAALLVRASLRLGQDTRYLKPVQTGSDSDTDTVFSLSGLERELLLKPVVGLPLAASVDQAAAAVKEEVVLEDVLTRTRTLLASAPDATWILEGAGGLRVPWNAREDQADFLQALEAPVVLVARSGLGTLNHSLLTLEALAVRRIPVRALFLVGQPHPQNLETLARRLLDLPIFEVPWFKKLRTEHLDLWLETEPRFRELLASRS